MIFGSAFVVPIFQITPDSTARHDFTGKYEARKTQAAFNALVLVVFTEFQKNRIYSDRKYTLLFNRTVAIFEHSKRNAYRTVAT